MHWLITILLLLLSITRRVTWFRGQPLGGPIGVMKIDYPAKRKRCDARASDSWLRFYRATLCIRGTSHGPVPVCLSVTSRCSTKTTKRRITQTTPHDTPRDFSVLMPKISAKFDRGHPLRGRQMQVGWVKIGDSRQITGYTSKTVKDRHIVSIKVE